VYTNFPSEPKRGDVFEPAMPTKMIDNIVVVEGRIYGTVTECSSSEYSRQDFKMKCAV